YSLPGNSKALDSSMKSMNTMKNFDDQIVIRSHVIPFIGANARIDEIIAHHEYRLHILLDSIKEGVTIYEACNILFKKELTIHETRFAVGEAFAHLEYLRYQGDCQREVQNGVYSYTIR